MIVLFEFWGIPDVLAERAHDCGQLAYVPTNNVQTVSFICFIRSLQEEGYASTGYFDSLCFPTPIDLADSDAVVHRSEGDTGVPIHCPTMEGAIRICND